MRNLMLGASALLCLLVFVGCPARKDAIAVSQSSYDFGMSRQPWNLEVWNSNPSLSKLSFEISSPTSWITCSPASGTSANINDRRVITVSVSRYGLGAGTHSGTIVITGQGVKPREIAVSLTSDGSESAVGALRVEDVSRSYSSPNLMDFTFVVQDKNYVPVIVDPASIGVACSESNVPVDTIETPAFLTHASAKQGAIYLVLDYTASMAATPGAISAMESAIKNVFLPALTADTLVGVYEFHHGDTAAGKVCGFSADKDYVGEQIDTIRGTVGRYAGTSRCWDAVYAALSEFPAAHTNDETRTLVFISDGKDTSSIKTPDNVRELALARSVRVYCIGFGEELSTSTLQAVTSQTPGRLYVAVDTSDIATGFEHIVDNFAAQYSLRWATLKQGEVEFVPSFKLDINDSIASYVSPAVYKVKDYAGNARQGMLRIVQSVSGGKTTYFLRASYVPRFVWDLWVYAQSDFPFTVGKVAAEDNGLCADCVLTTEGTPQGGMWIKLSKPEPLEYGSSLPFAGFGPIIRFDFGDEYDPQEAPFTALEVDNTIYPTNGPSFVIN